MCSINVRIISAFGVGEETSRNIYVLDALIAHIKQNIRALSER